MVDTRFYISPSPVGLLHLLDECGGEAPEDPRGETLVISGADELGTADHSQVALAASKAYAADLPRTRAGAVIVSAALRDLVPAHCVAVVSSRPHELFVDILEHLYPASLKSVVTAERPDLAEPLIEADVHLGPNVIIGRGAEIGRNTVIGPNTVIGAGVTIGRDSIIGANCTIHCSHLGNRVTVHPGARLGTEGFGWLGHGTTNRKIPQLGRLIVQDACEIGPNATLDRGALGDTVIGEGTKLGNGVVIGHNSRLGRNCLLAPTTGLAGTTVLGDGVVMGAGVGTSGHLSIGDGAIVYARAAVTKDWPAGVKLAGAPAQDIKDFWREIATVRRLTKGDQR
ncbi:UDP-3-O-acylglucosamine N-acyltransferase [Devosia pacifica]|uniref:UDP-3-O-acylglucosamine N-acyltransferase n=1 Tax=Devosia pacifica TaxID=1335967 RepID=A0A918VNI8_9HYPH|nr:UDP-3-O-(3-hydroxymyristoyl)glucosamine N-acyltransferase [Devosia pacifica]GHA10692.1 UDP-3-O-acylglucosamine N-acyltransferase [Devosia pacifica]